MSPSFSIEKLTQQHGVEGFDCGSEALNRFLTRYALVNQVANASQTYVGLADGRLVGFYTLTVGQVAHENATARLKKGLAQHPVPIMLLARLAVGREWQGRGIGAGLLKDALRRTLQAADIAGIRAFAVYAKNDEAREFYEHFDFISSPTDPYHLFLLLKDGLPSRSSRSERRLVEESELSSNQKMACRAEAPTARRLIEELAGWGAILEKIDHNQSVTIHATF